MRIGATMLAREQAQSSSSLKKSKSSSENEHARGGRLPPLIQPTASSSRGMHGEEGGWPLDLPGRSFDMDEEDILTELPKKVHSFRGSRSRGFDVTSSVPGLGVDLPVNADRFSAMDEAGVARSGNSVADMANSMSFMLASGGKNYGGKNLGGANRIHPLEADVQVNGVAASGADGSGDPAAAHAPNGKMRHMQTRGKKPKRSMSINPRSPMMSLWDPLMTMLLLWTAVFAPYEAAFIYGSHLWLLVVNTSVDMCFLGDLGLNFFLEYYDESSNAWVSDLSKIRWRYLKGWFLIDLFSSLPYELVASFNIGAIFENLTILKIIKVLRLIKLLRVLRAGRLIQRLESTTEIDYSMLELMKNITGILFMMHWMTCVWRAIAGADPISFDSDGEPAANWLAVAAADVPWPESDSGASWDSLAMYLAALQLVWQGELTCVTPGERLLMVLSIGVQNVMLGYMIGELCAIVGAWNADKTEFNRRMEGLNRFMRERNISLDLRARLREFMRYRQYAVNDREREILEDLSPSLRVQLALELHTSWMQNVHVFKDIPSKLMVVLADLCSTVTIAPGEPLFQAQDAPDSIFVVFKGVVVSRGEVMRAGGVIGISALLENSKLRGYSAVALTYSVLFKLFVTEVNDAFAQFPSANRKLRKHIVRKTVRDGIIAFTHTVRKQQAMDGTLVPTSPSKLSEKTQYQFLSHIAYGADGINTATRIAHAKLAGEDESIAKLERAAVSIQRRWRGYEARLRVKTYKLQAKALDGMPGPPASTPAQPLPPAPPPQQLLQPSGSKATNAESSSSYSSFASRSAEATGEQNRALLEALVSRFDAFERSLGDIADRIARIENRGEGEQAPKPRPPPRDAFGE
mmetsp:Transcript_8193/g.27219  ORF Transcript_8193/g.27219 Transcript_8193/m.27219 type:complete len:862 (+) Transcript_8193:128-2713(+)